jgi:phosphoserine phosphatase RsbU/P
MFAMNATLTGKAPSVLIIDDSPTNVKVLELALKKSGFMTISAFNGPDGERLAEVEQPDLILLDIMMPGKSGFDTCSDLKRNPLTKDIPIIFLSAMDDVASKVNGLSIGAVDYVTKPFHKEEVLARINLQLQLRLSRQAALSGQASRLQQLRKAQQTMLARPADLPQANFAVHYAPVLEAGGDFYDVVAMGETVFGYLAADMSGHDLGASFTTAALKALFRQNARPGLSPVETMKVMNDALASILSDGSHLTACYVHLDRTVSRLSVVSAGHPPAIYVSAAGDVDLLEATGDVLGVFNTPVFELLHREVSTGDRFFLYTDGLVERTGKEKRNRRQGVEELMEVCVRTLSLSIDRAVAEIIECLIPQTHAREDDVVLLGVEV